MTSSDLKILLAEVTTNALATPPNDEEARLLQSVIGMVSTLIDDGQLASLSTVLQTNFPAYYTDRLPPEYYPPMSAN